MQSGDTNGPPSFKEKPFQPECTWVSWEDEPIFAIDRVSLIRLKLASLGAERLTAPGVNTS